MELYLDGVVQEAESRESSYVYEMEDYATLRRDTSGLRPSFVLAEFAAGLDLPDNVTDNPKIKALEDAVNDWVSWTNVSNRTTNKFLIVHWLTNLTQDVFSYAKEQTVDGTHNLVVVLMREHNIELQSAMDLAGQRCIDCITKFEEIRQILPTWGAEVDQQVARYVQGLQNWIVGSLYWSFACRRYFGSQAESVKRGGIIRFGANFLNNDYVVQHQ